MLLSTYIFWFGGILGSASSPKFLISLRLENSCWLYALIALPTPQKVISNWKLVMPKMLDFSDCTKTDISILTQVADSLRPLLHAFYF